MLGYSHIGRKGVDIGHVHVVPELSTPDPSRTESNLPISESATRGDNAKHIEIDMHPMKNILHVSLQKKQCALSGDVRENSRAQMCGSCFTQLCSMVTTCSHHERLEDRPAKSRTLFVKLNEKDRPYASGIGTDLLDLANGPQVNSIST